MTFSSKDMRALMEALEQATTPPKPEVQEDNVEELDDEMVVEVENDIEETDGEDQEEVKEDKEQPENVAYKIQIPATDMPRSTLEELIESDFIENQEIVTIEYTEIKGNTLYIYPHFDKSINLLTQAELQKEFTRWVMEIELDNDD